MKPKTEAVVYADRRPFYESYSRALEALIGRLVAEEHLKVYVESRAKSIESFNEKRVRPGKLYTDPLSEITDLAGVRVFCPDGHTVDHVCKVIRANFHVDESKSVDKRRILDADRFGYSSVHLIVCLSAVRVRLPEWQRYAGVPAEIQVRTILAHAWALLAHRSYKRKSEVPVQLLRRLARLAALLEVADQEMLEVAQLQAGAADRVASKIARLDFAMPLDVLTLNGYLRRASIISWLRQLAGQTGRPKSHRGLPQLFQLSMGLGLAKLQLLDRELEATRSDPNRLRAFLADSRVHPYTADRAYLALLALLFRNFQRLDGQWLETHLNWQVGFKDALWAAIRTAIEGGQDDGTC